MPTSLEAASLAEIQERFYALVTAPEGVGQALAEAGLAERDLGALVIGDQRLDAVARLDVYANMYFYRILDLLRDAYPRLVTAVGDAAFHNLVTAYLLACPPRHPSIAFTGDRLPAFLAGHALAAESPWLVPLAHLERAHTELFDGPDAATLSLDQMRTLAPDQLPALPLRLVPCHRVLEHPFALDPLWRALEQGQTERPAAQPEVLLVWRQEVEVTHRPVDAEERSLLELASAGTTLGRLCDRVSAESAEEGALAVFNVVGRWLADGLVRDPASEAADRAAARRG
jgi:putative DNA-binding protein